MRDNAILVVGGAGYVGSHVAKTLQKSGYFCVILDDLSTGHRKATRDLPLEVGSYGDTSFVRDVIRRHRIHTVMHFGAKSIVPESVQEPLRYYRANVTDTIALLEAMRAESVKYCVFSSTCSTFGEPALNPIDELQPQKPTNPYGWSKLLIERVMLDCEREFGLKTAILRYFNASGADPEGELGEDHEPETHLIPRALLALQGLAEPLTVFGTDYPTKDGSAVRDYIHVMDLADAHVLAMKRLWETQKSDDFNLGSESGSTVFEVLAAIRQVAGKEVPHQLGPRRAGDTPVLIGDSRKAARVLGWRPKFGLAEIVRTAHSWSEKQVKSRSKVSAPAGRTLFLDRDGTINKDLGTYVSEPKDLKLLPGAAKALVRARRAGLKLVVITNQAGIAKGVTSLEGLEKVHSRMVRLIQEEGADPSFQFDAIYFCPHHPDERCACRKPGHKMILDACAKLGIRSENACFIGDKDVDLGCAAAAGVPAILVLTGYGQETLAQVQSERRDLMPAHVAQDLMAAVNWVLTQRPGEGVKK
jgi:UDP-glucose-4-epimerase GalE